VVIGVDFKIALHREVIRDDSRHFDDKTKSKIKKKIIEMLGSHPKIAGEALSRELAGYRKLKIFDDYRIVYRVDEKKRQVFILAVGIRRHAEIYKQALKRLQS
jgi:addiction module RelE/StbE family toxin